MTVMLTFFSRRVFILLLAIFAVAVSAFIIASRESTPEDFVRNAPENRSSALSSLDPEQDPDNDGLKDWQEALWRTDRNTPDTDGDGTSDGEEVTLKRNPLIPGPDDALSIDTSIAVGNATLTERVSKDLYTQYSLLDQQGNIKSTEVQQALLQELSESGNLDLEVQLYTQADLYIDTTNNHRQYAEDMGNSILFNLPKEKESSLQEIVEEVFEKGNLEALSELSTLQERYSNLTTDIVSSVAVPEDVVSSHLLFINSLQAIQAGMENMLYMVDDPLRGLLGFDMYYRSTEAASGALTEIEALFNQKSLSFEQGESGYVFLYGI